MHSTQTQTSILLSGPPTRSGVGNDLLESAKQVVGVLTRKYFFDVYKFLQDVSLYIKGCVPRECFIESIGR